MTLLEEILASSAEWPDWQSDALRRLFSKGHLDQSDLAEIRSMIEGVDGAPLPIRLVSSHIPQLGDGETTILVELRDLQNVNGFVSGRAISFSTTGLSVIFGENGTGKSGYSRVLKRACRARHAHPVLPHAFGQARGKPSAKVVVVDQQGTSAQHSWIEGSEGSAQQLAMISVYDSKCGEDYISEEGPCEFQPYGLPFLGILGRTQTAIQAAVAAQRDAIRLDPSPFNALKGEHPVGRIISSLSSETDLNAVRELSVFGDSDVARLLEIARIQATLDVETPAKAADALATRLDGAAQRCKTIELITSDRAVDRLLELARSAQLASEADQTAQALLQGSEVGALQGTGGGAWKLLFEAAQNYSREAYPEATHHPAIGDGAKCVLCQQDLAPEAQSRLDRFRTYVAGEAATAAASARQTLHDAVVKVGQTSLDPIDEATAAELRDCDPGIAEKLGPARTSWIARQQWAGNAFAEGDWNCPRPAPSPLPALSTMLTDKAAALRTKASELRQSKNEQKIKALTRERDALVARRSLAALLPQITKYVEDASTRKKLTAVHSALQTRPISTLITKLSERHVTEALAQALQKELSMLGYSRSPQPVLTTLTRRGENRISLALEGASTSPAQVLSEGEQRAMGLALFLAEARLRGDKSTIVFDDPSTSLDHRFRARIAERLVRLSHERPVVVFTHDAVFLTELQMASSGADITPSLQTVQWEGGAPGAVMSGLAWENKDFKKQLAELCADTEALARTANRYLNDDERRSVRDLHSRLRGAIERGVREVILNDVVHPFVDEIRVARLGAIAGFTIEEWRTVVDLHDRCSAVIAAHDTSSDRQQEIPHPIELRASLKKIGEAFEVCVKRIAAFNKDHYTPHMDKRSKPRKA